MPSPWINVSAIDCGNVIYIHISGFRCRFSLLLRCSIIWAGRRDFLWYSTRYAVRTVHMHMEHEKWRLALIRRQRITRFTNGRNRSHTILLDVLVFSQINWTHMLAHAQLRQGAKPEILYRRKKYSDSDNDESQMLINYICFDLMLVLLCTQPTTVHFILWSMLVVMMCWWMLTTDSL